MWGGCLIDLLDSELPGHGLTRDLLDPHLQNGFPWHEHETLHPHLNDPIAWWAHLDTILAGALARAGLSLPQASGLISGFRDLYLAPSSWHLFPDALDALTSATDAEWRNVIVSNHTPELSTLVSSLGLSGLVEVVVTSAVVGAEKPNAALFRAALDLVDGPEVVWMIGDNPITDIAGAARLGIPGVLVRAPQFTADYIDLINRSWGSPNWPDWQDHCRYRAENALAAIQLVGREVERLSRSS